MINKNKVAVSIQGVLVFSPWHSRQKRDSGTLNAYRWQAWQGWMVDYKIPSKSYCIAQNTPVF